MFYVVPVFNYTIESNISVREGYFLGVGIELLTGLSVIVANTKYFQFARWCCSRWLYL